MTDSVGMPAGRDATGVDSAAAGATSRADATGADSAGARAASPAGATGAHSAGAGAVGRADATGAHSADARAVGRADATGAHSAGARAAGRADATSAHSAGAGTVGRADATSAHSAGAGTASPADATSAHSAGAGTASPADATSAHSAGAGAASIGAARADAGDAGDGAIGQRPSKRERLVGAACQLLYEQGIERTTIADIARAADVPLGNVYYYFKTKDEIIAAVIDAHLANIEAMIASLDRHHHTPAARLKAMVHNLAEQGETIARYGCPQGTLCSELDKRYGGADPAAARLMRTPINWAERQFRSMGRSDARELAVELISGYEGTAVLTNALGEPELMARKARQLERWIDSLTPRD